MSKKKATNFIVDISFVVSDLRDNLFEDIWNGLMTVYLINNFDEGIEWLITTALLYFGELNRTETLWKKIK